MPGTATLRFQLEVVSNDGETTQSVNRTLRWSPAVDGGKREVVSLTGSGAFTALSPPDGAIAVCIIPAATAASLTLKGVTGDTGTTIAPTSNPINGPTFLFLGFLPSLGIKNGGSTTSCTLIWL
jgi:hypothetical protein